jgi:hypothetical protein
VFVEIAADRHCGAFPFRGQPPGGAERLAETLAPSPSEFALAPHGREGTVQMQIGEMEETNGHALLRQMNRDRGRTSVRAA